jgi:hypothetical protein
MKLYLKTSGATGRAIIGVGFNPDGVVELTEQIPGKPLGSTDVVLAWDIPPDDPAIKKSTGTLGARVFLVSCAVLNRFGPPTVYEYPTRI